MAPPLEDSPARGEFSLVGVPAFNFTDRQEPEQWKFETCDEDGIERAKEVVLINDIILQASSDFKFQQMEDNQTRDVGAPATVLGQEVRIKSQCCDKAILGFPCLGTFQTQSGFEDGARKPYSFQAETKVSKS